MRQSIIDLFLIGIFAMSMAWIGWSFRGGVERVRAMDKETIGTLRKTLNGEKERGIRRVK